MTTLTPRRDALIAAAAEARTASGALPAPETRVEAINRELSHCVLEAVLTPIAELMDLGVSGNTAAALLANALGNTIASFCLSCANGDENMANIYAVDLLNKIIDRTNSTINERATIEVAREFVDSSPKGRQ